MKFPTLSRRFWIALTTLAVIGTLFAYYLLVYVGAREEKLRTDKYRALTRYGENMVKARVDYGMALERSRAKGVDVYKDLRANYESNPPIPEVSKNGSDVDSLIKHLEDEKEGDPFHRGYNLGKWVDSFENKIQKENDASSNRQFWRSNGKQIRECIQNFVHEDLPMMDFDGYMSLNEYHHLQHQHFDRVYFDFVPLNGPSESDSRIVFSMSSSDFAYHPHQFDQFFIIKQFDESFHKHDKPEEVTANETFQTFRNRVNLERLDSFMVEEKGLMTSRFGDITLADTKYKRFIHSVNFSEDETWYLCGLIETKNFNAEVREVDPFIITAAALVFLFLIVAMPVLKLMIMNIYERISLLNVWSAGFSIVIGSAVFFLIIWSVNHNLQSRDEVDEELKLLSGKIKVQFQYELNSIFTQLEHFRSCSNTEPICRWVNAGTAMSCWDTVVVGNFQEKFKGDSSVAFTYPFTYLAWISSNGNPIVTLTTKDKKPDYKMPNLRNRKYFSRALNDSTWVLPANHEAFSLQSISSWTDHAPEAGFGIKSSKEEPFAAAVLALSTPLYSLTDPLLPAGSGFAVIDEEGEVWFHSNSKKNHQENLFAEIDQSDKMVAAVKGRGTTALSTNYEGTRARMFVQPIDQLPLYLVVFQNRDYQRTPVVLTILLTFALAGLLFLVQGIHMLILLVCQYWLKKIRTERFFLKLFRPDESHRNMYIDSMLVQSVLAIISLCFYFWGSISTVVGFISLPVMLMAFHLALYHGWNERGVILFVTLSICFLGLIDIVAFYWLSTIERTTVIGQQLLFVFVLLPFATIHRRRYHKSVSYKRKNSKENKIITALKNSWKKIEARLERSADQLRNRFAGWRYPHVYHVYILLWLFLVSVFPILHFYKMAYSQETLLWAKYLQLEEMNASIARERMLDARPKFLTEMKLPGYDEKMGDYLEEGPLMDTTNSHDGEQLAELLFESWPRFGEPFGISSAAAFNAAADRTWEWRKSDNMVEICYQMKPGVVVTATKEYGHFNPIGGKYGPLIALIAVLGGIGVYMTITFCTKYIFGIGILPLYPYGGTLSLQNPNHASHKLFLVGLPLSNGIHGLEAMLTPNGTHDLVDFHRHRRTWKSDKNVCVIQHFEFGLNDHEFNEKKLTFIQGQLEKHDRQVIILSTVQPSAIVEMYRKRICDGPNHSEKEENKEDTDRSEQCRIAIRKWRNLLGEFEVHYRSVCPALKLFRENDMVFNELNSCYYLQNLALKNDLKLDHKSEEDFIMNVEEVAEPYYNALWNSFSPEEKLLLFDLAHDGFVNLKNQRGLRILMQKGVIVVRNDALCIMNQSFTNYILSVYRVDEEKEVNKKIQALGSWQQIQVVLVIVMIAIVVFIAVAQKELFNNLNAFVMAVTGALTLLSRFGGMFGVGSKVKE